MPMQRPGDPAGRATIGQFLALAAAAVELDAGTDFDSVVVPGVYILTSDANAPFAGGRWFVRVRSDPVDPTAIVQEAVPLTGGTGPTPFSRRAAAGVFGAWISSGAPDASGVPYDDSNAFPGATNVQEALEAAADPWASLPLRVPIPVFDHLGGGAPPTDKWYRYVKLSAGETGAGGYNEGILASESVSGSAPYITATAEIDLPSSPLHGQTIHLIGTERRFIRAGSSGLTQDDQIKKHNHTINGYLAQNTLQGPVVASAPGNGGITSPTTNETGGDETRPRNIGATYFMRIL
ncbi:hypothetical protein GCM10008026_31800 [Chelatococcus composti]|nr:hypothetical protein GCM10008026_31800 [Chelatococcus composti]